MGIAVRPRASNEALGRPSGIVSSDGGGTVEPIDPETLVLTGYWFDYEGTPFEGKPSAGPSEGRDLIDGDEPAIGPDFGTHPSAEFNGTTNFLQQGLSMDSFLAPTGYTIEIVCSASALLAAQAAAYDEVILWGDNGGNCYLSISDGGVRVGHHDEGGGGWTGYASIPEVGTKMCVQAKYDGEVAKVRINGGAWATAERGTAVNMDAVTPRVGVNYASATFLEGHVSRIFTAQSAFDDATLDGTYAHAQSGFGVPGGAPPLVWTQDQIGTLPDGSAPTPYNIRDGAHLVKTASGRILLIGGWNPYLAEEEPIYGPDAQIVDWDGYTTNEVWASDDGGATFQVLLAHDLTPPTSGAGARFQPFHTGGVVQLDAYTYVVGSDVFDVRSDVWRSGDNGETWERMTAAAEWGDRFLHMTAAFDGALYVMGGQTDLNDKASALQDVWRSTDGGATWTQLADAPWAKRGLVYTPCEHDGSLFICGGGTYDAVTRDYYNDVWRFDGATWIEVLADGHLMWEPRQYHNMASTGSRLWVASGWHEVNLNSIAYSDDNGVTWAAFSDGLWPPSHADGFCSLGDRILHATGNGMFGSLDRGVYRIYQT